MLLLYAPLVHTCLNLLQCQYTPSADGEEEALVSPSHDVLCRDCTYMHPPALVLGRDSDMLPGSQSHCTGCDSHLCSAGLSVAHSSCVCIHSDSKLQANTGTLECF